MAEKNGKSLDIGYSLLDIGRSNDRTVIGLEDVDGALVGVETARNCPQHSSAIERSKQ